MKGIVLAIALLLPGIAHAQVSVQVAVPAVSVRVAPPPLRAEVRPVAPTAAHVWIAGHWAWRANRHVWIPGY